MPVLILLGIFLIWSVVGGLRGSCTKAAPPRSGEDIERMLGQMIGKSKKEARRIVRNYKRPE